VPQSDDGDVPRAPSSRPIGAAQPIGLAFSLGFRPGRAAPPRST